MAICSYEKIVEACEQFWAKYGYLYQMLNSPVLPPFWARPTMMLFCGFALLRKDERAEALVRAEALDQAQQLLSEIEVALQENADWTREQREVSQSSSSYLKEIIKAGR